MTGFTAGVDEDEEGAFFAFGFAGDAGACDAGVEAGFPLVVFGAGAGGAALASDAHVTTAQVSSGRRLPEGLVHLM